MEWLTTESGKYRIESLSAATIAGALNVIKVAFFQDETVCIGCEVNLNPAAGEVFLELCADVALDGVSLVAVEVASGEVVAVAFNTLVVAKSDASEKTFFEIFAEERCSQESSRAVMKFVLDVEGRCNFFEMYGVDCSFEIMYLATLREHRGNKLGKLLFQTSIELAKKLRNGPVTKITVEDLGPKYSFLKPRVVTDKIPKICQAILSAKQTMSIARSLGFTIHVTIPMSEFIYKGKSYAERLKDDTAVVELASLVLGK